MARAGNGTYSLASGNPVVTGTTIESSWANNTMTDIEAALTDSLSRSGLGGMTSPLRLVDGTLAAPALSFTNAPTIGIISLGVGIGYTIASTLAFSVTAANTNLYGTNPPNWWDGTAFRPLARTNAPVFTTSIGIGAAVVTEAELGYLQGTTSDIQTQFNAVQTQFSGKANTIHSHSALQITSDTFPDPRISQSNVTQHQAALTITTSQISDFTQQDIYLTKPVSTIRSSTIVVTDDPHLLYSIPSVGTYAVEIVLAVVSNSGGFRYALLFTGSASVEAWYSPLNSNTANTRTPLNTVTAFTTSGTSNGVVAKGVFNATTLGFITLRWAQNVSSVQATQLNRYSYMKVTKLT